MKTNVFNARVNFLRTMVEKYVYTDQETGDTKNGEVTKLVVGVNIISDNGETPYNSNIIVYTYSEFINTIASCNSDYARLIDSIRAKIYVNNGIVDKKLKDCDEDTKVAVSNLVRSNTIEALQTFVVDAEITVAYEYHKAGTLGVNTKTGEEFEYKVGMFDYQIIGIKPCDLIQQQFDAKRIENAKKMLANWL